jgi:hypothetical protein
LRVAGQARCGYESSWVQLPDLDARSVFGGQNRLSAYLDRVRDVEEIVITVRGRPVARLTGLPVTNPA